MSEYVLILISKVSTYSVQDSRLILRSALYNTDLVGQTQPTKRPLHWVAIKLDEKSPIVVLEVSNNKENVEIVGWYTLDDRNLERIKRQAEKNGGELVILSTKDKVESLSTPQNHLSSTDKDTNNPNTAQTSEAKNMPTDKQVTSIGTSNSASEKKSASKAQQKGIYSRRDFSVKEEAEDVNYSDALSKDSGLHFGKGKGKSVVIPKDFLPTKKQVKEDRFAQIINGIHYRNGFAFVTNGTRVIAIRCDYPAEYEGKTINDGTIVEGEYPNVNNIIPVVGNMFNYTASIVSEISQLPKSIEYVVLNGFVFNRSNISPLIDLARKAKNAQLFLDKGGKLCLIGDGVLGMCINTEDATDSIIDGFKPNTI